MLTFQKSRLNYKRYFSVLYKTPGCRIFVLSAAFPSCVVGLRGAYLRGHTSPSVFNVITVTTGAFLAADGRHALICSKGRLPDSCLYFVIIAHSLKQSTPIRIQQTTQSLCSKCIADLRPGSWCKNAMWAPEMGADPRVSSCATQVRYPEFDPIWAQHMKQAMLRSLLVSMADGDRVEMSAQEQMSVPDARQYHDDAC